MNDFEWNNKGRRIAVVMPPERITFELDDKVSPLAVQNFLSLCTGHKGKSSAGGGKNLHYKDCHVHRLVKNFIVQVIIVLLLVFDIVFFFVWKQVQLELNNICEC